jgi:hypothetical protein
MRFLLSIVLTVSLIGTARSSHILGGELTWSCQGGSYIFTLAFYRDCNGADINAISEIIRVWNHPTLTTLTLPFVSRTDISPQCTEVAGGPEAISCGSGPNAGNGPGAIEKVIYESAPIAISGIPPAQGWVFTYDNFSRNGNITNLDSPASYGMTITAKIFPSGATAGTCADNSPVFLQAPNFVTCAGQPYTYNMNVIDPDLDSISVSFGTLYSDFLTGVYNPPTSPVMVPFESGFSASSPTPSPAMNPGNVSAQLDSQSGTLSFTSAMIGNFAMKLVVKSFRYGNLIGEVERELQVSVQSCNAANNAPVIVPPFPGNSFETTIAAGSLVNFTFATNDLEFLQNGSPQSNSMQVSGPMFGTNFTSTSGCANPPCATLNTAPIITGIQGVSVDFSWQTTCDHLVGTTGNGQDVVPYHFVFRVQDDFCPVPKVVYATITINVLNEGVIEAPQISCIQANEAGDVTLQWVPVLNPFGTFVEYQVHSVQNGLLATLNNPATSSWTEPGVTQQNDYFLVVISGCNGNAIRYSDTLANIFLELNNPSNGTAILQWNAPSANASQFANVYYHILREYPVGNWVLMDSVPYGVGFYKDTIDICESFLRYRVVLPYQACDMVSNAPGDDFEDMLTPNIPVISSASIDSTTQQVLINWNENPQPDTYGYVVYSVDNNGFLFELDTVWGIGSTSYLHNADITTGPLTYAVAAFDSCVTTAVPPTFQTSAKSILHSTMFLTHVLSICNNKVDLNWTPYLGWAAVDRYEIIGSKNGETWQSFGSTDETAFSVSVESLADYCFAIKAISPLGDTSFSTRVCLTVIAPTLPAFHYLQVATVNNGTVELKHLIDQSSGVAAISFERQNSNGLFESIAQVAVSNNLVTYTDLDVEVNEQSYTYRARLIDSCGKPGAVSNIARTVLLDIQYDEVRTVNYLNWSSYIDFDGQVQQYYLYRGLDGVYPGSPLAILSKDVFSYQDDVSAYNFTGKVCYLIDAVEGDNLYNSPQVSRSNEACAVYDPILYVPNAFFPDGINKVFKPVISLFDPANFSFSIYDRLGRILFETNDPQQGWTGEITLSGERAGPGVYQYLITMQDGQGILMTRRGHVTLID